MVLLLYICAAGLVLVLIILLIILKIYGSAPKARNDGRPVARPAPARQAEMAGGVRRGARRRMVVRQRHDDEDEDEDPEIEPLFDESGQPKKIGAKKMRKLQEKAEKRAQREAEEEERRERKRQQELREELEKKSEEQRKAEEAAKEAEEAKRREEQERREHEEYLKLKEAFTVEEEGTHEDELNLDTDSLLQEFINYIKDMKVVMLEDLAAHFKMKTQDAIDRINTLLEESRLSGVLDDRGKFIYITSEEYQAVAKFIKQRGRVSITELAESSNKLINLNPENLDVHKKLVGEVA